MFANPRLDLVQRTIVGVKHFEDKLFTFIGREHQLPPVQAQEYVSCKERDPFAAIGKGMIEQQRLEHSGRHFFNMIVVARLWPKEGAFQESPVANTMVAAKSLDQSLLNYERFIEREKLN